MSHHIVRSVLLADVVRKIESQYEVDENHALNMFYKSNIGKLFSEDESGLYGQSPNYIFSLFREDFDSHRN